MRQSEIIQKVAGKKNKGGRPSKLTPELIEKICERVREGDSIRTVSKMEDMPAESSIYNWLGSSPEFLEKYARAREERADRMAEEILEIADETDRDTIFIESKDEDGDGAREVPNHEWINRSKLRVDTRKWLMSKLAPKKYGDKITQEVTGKDGAPITPVINIGIKPQE